MFAIFAKFAIFANFDPFIQIRSAVTHDTCHPERSEGSRRRVRPFANHEILRLRAQNDTLTGSVY